jgi:SAM-dependent methyltransferase
MTERTSVEAGREYWDRFAKFDPLWAILSDPARAGRRWTLAEFLATGHREVSLLMYQLRALGLDPPRTAALDFGCGIGRLSQPLAAHFDRVVGVDVSPEMIRLADAVNAQPSRVRYVANVRPDLEALRTGEFTFAYSNVVLQHIEPAAALRYLAELLRVTAAAGTLVFQLPSHLRPPHERQARVAAMPDAAYRAAIAVETPTPSSVAPRASLALAVTVTNTSPLAWVQPQTGPIRLGNHWLGPDRAMLVQDDGRVSLPERLGPGEACRLVLTATAPPEPGRFLLEVDVVHEGVTWFADRGSVAWRGEVHVGAEAFAAAAAESGPTTVDEGLLALPEAAEDPGPFPMHGVHYDVVTRAIADHGGALAHVERDERCGPEWVGYRYFVRKQSC